MKKRKTSSLKKKLVPIPSNNLQELLSTSQRSMQVVQLRVSQKVFVSYLENILKIRELIASSEDVQYLHQRIEDLQKEILDLTNDSEYFKKLDVIKDKTSLLVEYELTLKLIKQIDPLGSSTHFHKLFNNH